MQAVDPREFLGVVRPALEEGSATRLAQAVRARWTSRQLCGLLRHADVNVRRVAAVTVGLVGDAASAGCLARCLRDEDEQVNQMAEHSLWAVWSRSGNAAASRPFAEGVALLDQEAYGQAADRFRQAIAADDRFGEAYHQLGLALFLQGQWEAAADAFGRTLDRLPAHFGALSGLGHVFVELGRFDDAVRCYRRALRVNPAMPAVREAISRLERKLADPTPRLAGPAADLPLL